MKVSCIRDDDRLAVRQRTVHIAGGDDLDRPQDRLSDWLAERVASGDLRYLCTHAGIAIYLPLRRLHD